MFYPSLLKCFKWMMLMFELQLEANIWQNVTQRQIVY